MSQHLLVDLDGTLLGNTGWRLSLDFIVRATRRLRSRLGVLGSLSILSAAKRAFDRPHPEHTNDLRALQLFSDRLGISLDDARTFVRSQVGGVFQELRRHFYPVPGAREFILWARERFDLTLATNPVWPEEIAHLRLEWAGLPRDAFSTITHARNMKACKPSPEYYLELCANLGLKPEDCILIGDDVKMDLPATRVGIRVFIVGSYSSLKPLKIAGMRAPAWRGSYLDLRSALGAGGVFSTPASK